MAKQIKKKAESYLKELGERIVKAREEKGISQLELARRLNTYNNTIRRIEVGETNPTINTLREIAQALEVKLTDLIKD